MRTELINDAHSCLLDVIKSESLRAVQTNDVEKWNKLMEYLVINTKSYFLLNSDGLGALNEFIFKDENIYDMVLQMKSSFFMRMALEHSEYNELVGYVFDAITVNVNEDNRDNINIPELLLNRINLDDEPSYQALYHNPWLLMVVLINTLIDASILIDIHEWQTNYAKDLMRINEIDFDEEEQENPFEKPI